MIFPTIAVPHAHLQRIEPVEHYGKVQDATTSAWAPCGLLAVKPLVSTRVPANRNLRQFIHHCAQGKPYAACAVGHGRPGGDNAGKGKSTWGTPVESLHATRESPIFSPARPLRRHRVAVAPSPEPPKAAAPAEPDQPALNLVGTIFGSGEGYAGFLDTTTHGIVRPKTSKGEHGWILRSVTDREAVLEKNYRTVVVRLPTITGDRQ